jgi:CxxC motif-containing protein (DUF1111 family)
MRCKHTRLSIVSGIVWLALMAGQNAVMAQTPHDPGVRPAKDLSRIGGLSCTDVTKAVPGLNTNEEALFCAGAEEFAKENTVKDDGLGPTFNFTSCRGCHVFPSSGGTSPPDVNPQFEFAKKYPSNTNVIPFFIKRDGPIMIARLQKNKQGDPDGGVHSLFTVMGLEGAEGCGLKQLHGDFSKENPKNITNRIPTPTFGTGLMEQIEDDAIEHNVAHQADRTFGEGFKVPRARLNVVQPFHANGVLTTGGRANRNGNDGTIARFGWKAQNKSLLIFAGEAYNVEMGISNEVFPTEREEAKECQFHTVPNDISHPENVFDPDPKKRLDVLSDVEKFATFMRLLAPPERHVGTTPQERQSIGSGETIFDTTGCSACHTPTLTTSPLSSIAALRNKPVHLYSDLALHKMGAILDDGISQGQAQGNEFRSAPLWGLGQRIWFLHDGRTKNLMEAIELHYYKTDKPDANELNSDANDVIELYRKLGVQQKQDLLNFLRSL